MAFLPETFDANNVEPSRPREVIPAGKYPVQIIESDVKGAKTGNGTILALTFEVLGGPHAGRKLWSQLNIIHSSSQAQEIAQRDFSAICRAVGQLQVSDTEALHFKPLQVKVEVELAGTAGSGGYVSKADRNVIKGYEPVDGAPRPAAAAAQPQQAPRPQPQATQAPTAQASQPGARPASMPWKRTA